MQSICPYCWGVLTLHGKFGEANALWECGACLKHWPIGPGAVQDPDSLPDGGVVNGYPVGDSLYMVEIFDSQGRLVSVKVIDRED